MKEFQLSQIDRVVYIWARYSGTRKPEPVGKTYSKAELVELSERLKRFANNPDSFDNGFEKKTEED